MRILIVTTFFPPLNSIASLRPYSWAKYWSAAGHEVVVLTIKKEEDSAVALNLPCDRFRVIEVEAPKLLRLLRAGYRSAEGQEEKRLSLLRWTKRLAAAAFNKLRFRFGIFNACRMPDFTDLWVRPALRAVKEEGKWDLVISSAGPYAVHLVGNSLKKQGVANRWVADYRDSWSNNYIYPGIFPFNLIERLLERRLLARADLITTVSDPFAKAYIPRYGASRVMTVENGFDPDDSKMLPAAAAFPSDGKFRIVHTGSIYLGKRNPEPLFEAIAALAKEGDPNLERLEVLFVGARNANLNEMIAHWGVEKWAREEGFVSREKALAMQRDADLLLFLPWSDTAVDGVMTGKLFEYLVSGTPVIAVGASSLEASQRLILEARAGWSFFDVASIKLFLSDRLASQEKERCECPAAVIDRYSREKLAFKLLDRLASGGV